MPGEMSDIFLRAIERGFDRFFDVFEDRQFVSDLSDRARSDLKIKLSTAPGIEGASQRSVQRLKIEQRMMMLLPFCQFLSKHQSTYSLRLDSKKLEKIKRSLEEQLKKDPEALDNHSALISCLVLLGKTEDAENRLNELLLKNKEYGSGWYMLGALQGGFGGLGASGGIDMLEKAIAALQQASDLLPGDMTLKRYLEYLRIRNFASIRQ